MKLLIDAQLSPSIAAWINDNYPNYRAVSVWAAELRDKNDKYIYDFAKKNNFILVSKDSDFIRLIENFGCPPHLVWITMGNTSNRELRIALEKSLDNVLRVIQEGEPVVELSSKPKAEEK
jgi:predicted nuclease of predicted toxin-antitoxin system